MAMNSATLATLINSKLTTAGFDLAEAVVDDLATAIAEAIVEHIAAAAQVVVAGGSSAGTYSVT